MPDTFNPGWRSDLENRKSLEENAFSISIVKGLQFSAPDEIDPRPWHRIENQGSMGSCQGHAQSSVCEMAYHIATGEVIQFSPMWAYLMTQKIDGLLGHDNGSTIDGGRKSAEQNGSCPLTVFPYPNPVHYSTKIPDGAPIAAEPFKIRNHAMIRSYDDAMAFLGSGQGGIEIGISWGAGLQPDSNGIVHSYRGGAGGHALAFLGYTKGANNLWLANSWGEGWDPTLKGYAECNSDCVNQMCRDPNVVMIGMSDLTVPEDRSKKVDWTKNPVMG